MEIKRLGDSYIFDLTTETDEMLRGFSRNLESLCQAEFDKFAAANGYVKLDAGQVVLDRDDVQALCDRVLMDCGCDSCNTVTRVQIQLEAKP